MYLMKTLEEVNEINCFLFLYLFYNKMCLIFLKKIRDSYEMIFV